MPLPVLSLESRCYPETPASLTRAVPVAERRLPASDMCTPARTSAHPRRPAPSASEQYSARHMAGRTRNHAW